MRKFSILLLLLLLPIHQVAHSYELSCERDVSESELLKQSPNGATRINKHILEVKYSGGSKRFIDKPPHENLDGTHWKYCGYDKETRVHLIHKQIFGRFTGSLLSEDIGRTLSAGQTVLIDTKIKYILGIEKESGMDGELFGLSQNSGDRG